ncbi:MAG: aconitase family protein, partial [Acidimicrobiales bacterium]
LKTGLKINNDYYGPGLAGLSAMDRHVIANMGAELGATTTVFPADDEIRRFLTSQGRGGDYTPIHAESNASYDVNDLIDLSILEPLIARPSSPGNVVPVREVEGEPVFQVVVGSSANPGLRDFAVVAEIVKGRQSHDQVSFDVNPTSRQILEDLTMGGWLFDLIAAGARIHQSGCMGCIGMGQAPATGRNSLRTFPRNFPGRSGTKEDSVWLCSPETAAAAALTGVITDPRSLPQRLGVGYPSLALPERANVNISMLVSPLPDDEARRQELVKGPNITSLPHFDPPPDRIEAPVELKVGDDVSTDEILPAGARVLPFRSNIGAISQFAFAQLDEGYPERAARSKDTTGHIVVGGLNYGQGSSREHAAIAPRYLGLRAVIAKSFARIHWQNLANFGVVALEFVDPADYDDITQDDILTIEDLQSALGDSDDSIVAQNTTKGHSYRLRHRLSERQVAMVLAGGRIALNKQERGGHRAP